MDITQLFRTAHERLAAGEWAAAESGFRRLTEIDPALPEPYVNLGLTLERRGALAEAEAAYRRAVALGPTLADAELNLGALLASTRRHDEAAVRYARAISLDPQAPSGWSNLGALLASRKQDADAEAVCRKALSLDPAHGPSHINLAYLLLRQGRFEEGFAHMERRVGLDVLERQAGCPRWRGEPLDGRSLLVLHEGGHGDLIQFCRYVALLRERWPSVRITLSCPPALAPLLATLAGVDRLLVVNQSGVPTAGCDAWVPLMSLPLHLGTRVDAIPAALPYLHADPLRKRAWAERPGPADGLRVGLVWRGNPDFINDAERSVDALTVLAPLARVPGVRWISLQKGRGEDEARHPPAGFEAMRALGHELADFADTAAVVSQLDLVVSVDSAVAHLAGALGRPCWLMLPHHMTDWRWLESRSDTPWYPGTLRLFRQSPEGGWPEVAAAVAAALQTLAAG